MSKASVSSIASVMVVFAVVIAVSFGVFGAVVDGDLRQEIHENNKHFHEYCEDRFGEGAIIWVGGGQRAHSGLHCENAAGTTTVHLGQIPEDTWESYKRGDATTQEVTNSIQPIGPMGFTGSIWKSMLEAIPFVGAFIVVAYLHMTHGRSLRGM